MRKYNKAWQGGTGGGAGAALAEIIVWGIETFTAAMVPDSVETAMVVVLAIIGGMIVPARGPSNE